MLHTERLGANVGSKGSREGGGRRGSGGTLGKHVSHTPGLTQQQLQFAHHPANHGNGTWLLAAQRAAWQHPNCIWRRNAQHTNAWQSASITEHITYVKTLGKYGPNSCQHAYHTVT